MNFRSFMPFFLILTDFYLISMNLLFKKSQKGGSIYLQVASGEAGELTRGARDHHADATRL